MVLTAALALSACNMFGGNSSSDKEGARNEAASEEETKDGNRSRDEEENSDRGGRGEEDRRGGQDEGSGGGSRDGEDEGGRPAGGDDRQLNRELLSAVRQQRARLPMREGPGTITDMEVEGTQLIVTMRMDDDLGQSEWDEMAAALQRNLCNDRNSRRMIDRGASVLYQVTDADGERVNMNTSRCD